MTMNEYELNNSLHDERKRVEEEVVGSQYIIQ